MTFECFYLNLLKKFEISLKTTWSHLNGVSNWFWLNGIISLALSIGFEPSRKKSRKLDETTPKLLLFKSFEKELVSTRPKSLQMDFDDLTLSKSANQMIVNWDWSQEIGSLWSDSLWMSDIHLKNRLMPFTGKSFSSPRTDSQPVVRLA